MEDAIRPNEEKYRATYEQGFRTWYSLYLRAKQESALPQFCFFFRNAFQDQPQFPHNLDLRQSYNFLYAAGVSSWEIETLGSCRLPSFEQRLDIPVSINGPMPLVLRHADNTPNYRGWFSKEDNHLSVLILAWAYILSSRWAELMPQSTIRYTDVQAKWTDGGSGNSIVIDIGDVDEEKVRWWTAILAPGEGWQADITSGEDRFRSPWSIVFQDSPNLVLSYRKSRSPSSRAGTTASFTTALRFLSDYCTLHDIADQSLAALSATLFLPFLNRRDAVYLPTPTSAHGAYPAPTSSTNNVQLNWEQEVHHIDKLLTLSCNIKGIGALLSCAFYERGMPCNLVSPWLQSAFAVLNAVRDDHLLLAHILMSRVPSVAFLWLGGIIMGAHERILRDCRFGLIAIDLHSAVWSSTVQSFMQEPVSKYPETASDSSILRADECRLLFKTQAEYHTRLPICQWMPFGTTALKDTDLDVRLHAKCDGGHALKYGGWKWACKNGAIVQQKRNGRPPSPPPEQWGPLESHIPVSFEALDFEEESASANATRSIFGWLRFEGYPPTERDIHSHPWLKVEESDDEGEPPDFRDSKSSHLPQSSTPVEAWIAHHLPMST